MKALKIVFHELWSNRQRLWRLTIHENKAKSAEMVLGRIWNFLNPALQILVYWFVFDVGLHNGAVEGVPYVVWLTCGLLPWMYINNAMNNSSVSISQFSRVLQNIAFPLALVPAKSVFAAWFEHLYTVVIMFAVALISGVKPTWHMLEVVYYMVASLTFLTAFSLIASSLTAVFRDFHQFLQPMIRMLFYISNVVWKPGVNAGSWSIIMRINPLAYLIDGYRNALLYGIPFWGSWRQALCFWGITLVMLVIGCRLHVKLRDRFIDLV